jgi:hypothetical protein
MPHYGGGLSDRLLGAVLVLVLSAWAVSWAVHTIVAVVPALILIGGVSLGGFLAWRRYRERDSGW